MPFLEATDKKIFYETTGSGDPLVLIHGIALDSRSWRDLPEFLGKKYTVLTYDLRGHGQSFAPATGYSYRDHVNDLKSLLSELGYQKITLVGHSMGGAIAVKYALQHPDQVKSMVLAAPHIVGYADYTGWPNVYRTARNIDIDQARIQWEGFRLFERLPKGSPERELFLECLRDFPGKVWTDPQAGRYVDESDLKLLDKLTMSLLLLCGRADLDFLPLAKLVNAGVTNGSLFEIPDCGHMIHFEKPDIFKRELTAFLKL
jgi:pimeloyl-ACP methyl ester carboxylesterase